MKKRLAGIITLFVMTTVLLSGCESNMLIRTVDSLLTPPLYYTEYEGLVTVFNERVGSNVLLCNPIQGDHLSAITVVDIDNDGAEEAIVFYKDTIEEGNARFSLLKNVDGTWKFLGDYKGYGNQVNSLIFPDFDCDGVKEILIVWSYSGITNANVFSVYRSKGEGLNYRELDVQSCDLVKPIDLDADSREEIFFISTQTEAGVVSKTAKLLKLAEDDFKLIGKTPIDPQVGSYVSYKTEKYSQETPMKIYIDAVKTNNMMITEVIYWDSESQQLAAPLYDLETGSNNKTLRYEPIQCVDINNDGHIEIPIQTVYIEQSEHNDKLLYVTDWTYFEGNVPVLSERTFVNLENGYIVNLGTLSNKKLLIREQEGDGWTSWSVYTENAAIAGGNVLFTIIKVPKTRWEKEMSQDKSYITILKQQDGVICVNINENGRAAGLGEEQIRKIVTKLTQ